MSCGQRRSGSIGSWTVVMVNVDFFARAEILDGTRTFPAIASGR
jgi:hypothetical protein